MSEGNLVMGGTFPELNAKARKLLAEQCGHDEPSGLARWGHGFDKHDLRCALFATTWAGHGCEQLNETMWGVLYMVVLDLMREGFIHKAKLLTPTKKRHFVQCFPPWMETTVTWERDEKRYRT